MGRLYVFRLAVTWIWMERWSPSNGRKYRIPKPTLNRAKYVVTQWGPTEEEAMDAAVTNTCKHYATDDAQWGGFSDIEIDQLAYNQHVQYDVSHDIGF